MPHCIIEHSEDLDGAALVPLVHESALNSGLFDPQGSDIKVRAIEFAHYKTGSVDISFVHVTLRILPGRTAEQKSALTESVVRNLNSAIASSCSISAEVVDVDGATYAKVVV